VDNLALAALVAKTVFALFVISITNLGILPAEQNGTSLVDR